MIDLNTLTAKGLVTVDGASRRLGPINSMIGWIADRVLPDTTARAGGCPPKGYVLCGSHSCKTTVLCQLLTGKSQKIYYMVKKPQNHCRSGVYSCTHRLYCTCS